MSCTCSLPFAADLSAHLDLVDAPFTVRFSRLLVLRTDRAEAAGAGAPPATSLDIVRSVYERRMADSVVLAGLQVRDGSGTPVPVEAVCASCVHIGPARLLVTADDRVILRGLPAGWTVTSTDGPVRAEARLVLEQPGTAPEAAEAEIVRTAAEWMERCPEVRPQDRAMARFCWWVLGVNTLELGGAAAGRAVVPSKIGYVGHWQWDAYFIAVGLSHGDPELALEQMRLALSRPTDEGQLPDVLHEAGVLASSDDLPPGDLENLRAMASPALEGTRIPLTKPPLTAFALDIIAARTGPAIIDELRAGIARSQDWWFEHSDPGATGVPAYLHPYSSGLDDSPIFDHDAILRSPDLSAYLIGQDQVLARWAEQRGEADAAAAHRERAARLRTALEGTWDEQGRCFRAIGGEGPVPVDAIVGLMPLLVDGLQARLVEGLVEALEDPERYGRPFPAPTVSAADPAFAAQRMWRGPVWVNTNWLVIQGLRLQGREAEAKALAESTLAMVRAGGGPHEYFDAATAQRAGRATTCFGWSAALFLDLAVAAADHAGGAAVAMSGPAA
ncbi:MGH1-like glycoside hydrolase domain-containing protein [Brachybacterium hainanense]|uniref:Mannosylglycerate hydrolase MGH1-like glycoside hydrolase domain-containing protein n=1 Tax=Brachybacterium hainanense TaxID=1541174 RepID=A0ABV6RDT0_9MICO